MTIQREISRIFSGLPLRRSQRARRCTAEMYRERCQTILGKTYINSLMPTPRHHQDSRKTSHFVALGETSHTISQLLDGSSCVSSQNSGVFFHEPVMDLDLPVDWVERGRVQFYQDISRSWDRLVRSPDGELTFWSLEEKSLLFRHDSKAARSLRSVYWYGPGKSVAICGRNF